MLKNFLKNKDPKSLDLINVKWHSWRASLEASTLDVQCSITPRQADIFLECTVTKPNYNMITKRRVKQVHISNVTSFAKLTGVLYPYDDLFSCL